MAKYKISFSNDVIPINEIDKQQRKKLISFYKQAANNVKSQINALQTSSKQNTSTKLQIYRLKQLEESIDYNLKVVTGKVEKEIENNMKKVAEMTIEEYSKYMGSQHIDFKVSYAHLSNEIINNITSGNLYKDQYGADWNFSKRIWGDYTSAKGELATIVSNGIASGKGAYEIAKDLEKYVTPGAAKPWDWGKVYPGCRKVIDYNAQRLARTMVSHCYQQSIVEMSKHNPYVGGIQWRSALVERTCEICEQRHGHIYQPNDIPLDHPNGLCTYIMVFNKTTEEIVNDLANWVNGEQNKELDKYATYITGKDFSKMTKMQKMQNMKISKEKKKEINTQIVNGKDISETWIRRENEFDFAIEDVINAQGFDGMPRIVNSEEFDKLVKDANNGNGFIAQRTYSANDVETLNLYREQLYKGKWYVDCSAGGAQYGQGMYCAADYTGNLSFGIKSEMQHYISLNKDRGNSNYYVETLTLDKSAKIIKYEDLLKDFKEYYSESNMRSMAIDKAFNEFNINQKDYENFKVYIESELGIGQHNFREVNKNIKDFVKRTGKSEDEFYDIAISLTEKTDYYLSQYYDEGHTRNIGVYAVKKGYDAINAEGHGESGSYTVVLNRTKLIIKEPE